MLLQSETSATGGGGGNGFRNIDRTEKTTLEGSLWSDGPGVIGAKDGNSDGDEMEKNSSAIKENTQFLQQAKEQRSVTPETQIRCVAKNLVFFCLKKSPLMFKLMFLPLWICRYLIPELGPCSLMITYSAHKDLSVKFQSHRSRDYTNPMLPVASSAIDATGQFVTFAIKFRFRWKEE
ncbi:unnamed protein product [Lactuca virosa]|uniref:Uncharacterized protein n=1 Tax=Lactuca virosa TaxID=75947 RepID=A0AAU9NRF5_9ASTR|nr:unnamed protein product [Lactuca virosa]